MTAIDRQIVLTFHGIGEPPADVAPGEVPYWIGETEFSDLIGRLAASAKALDVKLVVTFDDGNRSDLLTGAPVLARYGLDGIFFPCSGRLGRQGYLDARDIRALIGAGFRVGSHGVDHRPWARMDRAALLREVEGSKSALEAAAGRPIDLAALPFGSYGRDTLVAVRSAGYRQVFSSDPGFSARGSWFVRRFSYQQGSGFDLPALVAEHSRPSRRILAAVKHLAKALR